MAAKKETYTYTEAMKRLEAIVAKIEGNELDIDELGEKLKEAQKLIKFCRDKLYKTDLEIQKMLGEEENGGEGDAPGCMGKGLFQDRVRPPKSDAVCFLS